MNMILENQVLQIVKFSKYVNYEKRVSKMIFFNEKKTRKIWMIFVIDNWLWKSDLGSQIKNVFMF